MLANIGVKEVSGLGQGIEQEISQAFTSDNNKFFISLAQVEKEVEKEVVDSCEPILSDICYKEIFNEKALKFLGTKDFKKAIVPDRYRNSQLQLDA